MGLVSDPGRDTDWGKQTKVQAGNTAICAAHGSTPEHRLNLGRAKFVHTHLLLLMELRFNAKVPCCPYAFLSVI